MSDIHSGAQSQGKAAIVQEAPKIVHRFHICNVQLHIHCVLNLS